MFCIYNCRNASGFLGFGNSMNRQCRFTRRFRTINLDHTASWKTSDPQQQRRIRLIFRSAKTTSIPLVARLATEEGISATVISANTQKLSEEVYGSMLLGVPNAQFEQAMDFLRSIENLQVEEASVDVQ